MVVLQQGSGNPDRLSLSPESGEFGRIQIIEGEHAT